MITFGRVWGSVWSLFSGTSQTPGRQDNRPQVNVSGGIRTPDTGIDGALQVSAVWAAIELITDNIASLPLFVYTDTNSDDRELARGTQLYRLMHDSPNSRHTPMEFWQFAVMSYLLDGNAFARLERNDKGEVIAMWPLHPDQVDVKVLKNGSLVYEYSYDNSVVTYPESKIWHWRDKGNGVRGLSRLQYMRSTINVANAAQVSTARLYANGNKRPGVFMIDKTLSAEQRAQIRANFAGLTEGTEDDLIVLEAGAKFEPLAMTPADVQLLETRRFTVEEIARWFGIPSALLNDTSKTTTWGTGITQLVQGFYKFKLRPMLVSCEQTLKARVLTVEQNLKYTVEFSLDALLRGDAKERAEIAVLLADHGLATSDELRQVENRAKMPGGDKLRVQMQFTTLDKIGTVAPTGVQNGQSSQGTQ